MKEDNAAGQIDDLNQQGSGNEGGEPTNGSAQVDGEPTAKKSQTDGEPTGEGLFDGMTPEDLHKSYKNIQGEFTKVKAKLKHLESYGGVEQVTKLAEFLTTDPDFAEWVRSKQAKDSYGFNPDETDDETKKAIAMVEKIVQKQIGQALNPILEQHIRPLNESVQASKLAENFKLMDDKYGDLWRDYEPDMKEKAGDLDPKVANKMSFKGMEGLLWSVIAEKGHTDRFAQKIYQKSLEGKKKKSTGEPTKPIPASGEGKAKTIEEAWNNAKRMVANQ